MFKPLSMAVLAALTLQGCASDLARVLTDPHGYYAQKDRADAAKAGIAYDQNGQARLLVIAGQVYTAGPGSMSDAPSRVRPMTTYDAGSLPMADDDLAADCIGAVVAGVCHGAVAPSAQSVNPQRCYGQMLNGQCTGPQF